VTPNDVCLRCRKPVVVARTEVHGMKFLLDPEPDPAGNQALMRPPAGPLQTRQLREGEEPRSYELPGRFMQPTAPVPLPDNVTPINRAPSRRGAKPSARK
jgi:hypothetical protein